MSSEVTLFYSDGASATPALSWELDAEHRDFQAVCRTFTNRHVRPAVDEAEALGRVPQWLWKEFGAAGLLGLLTPEECGGTPHRHARLAGAASRLPAQAGTRRERRDAGRHRTGRGLGRGGHHHFGGPRRHRVAAEWPQDVHHQRRPGRCADRGREDPAGCGPPRDQHVPGRGAGAGLSLGALLPKTGWHAADTREVILDNVAVPATSLLGGLNRGFYQVMHAVQLERVALAAMGPGHAAECLHLATEHARVRTVFGAPLTGLQTVRHKFAVMAVELEAARLMTYRAAQRLGAGHPQAPRSVAMAKYHTARAAGHIVDAAVQIFGGSGYIEESVVARHDRDVRVLRIGGGADEIQLEILSRELTP